MLPLITLAAVYFTAGFYATSLHLRSDRRELWLRAFAVGCFSLTVYCLGAALVKTQTRVAIDLKYAAVHLAAAALVYVVHEMNYRIPLMVRRATLGLLSIGLLVAIVGGAHPSQTDQLDRFSWVGWVVLGLTALPVSYCLIRLRAAAPTGSPERRVWGALVIATMVASVEQLPGAVTTLPPIFVISSLVVVGVFTSAFLEIHLRHSNELEEKTTALAQSHYMLRTTQQELELTRSIADLGRFSSSIANRVRNPIAAAKNAIAALRKQDSSNADVDLLTTVVEEEVAQLEHLVGQLLEYARPVQPTYQAVDVYDVLQPIAERWRGKRTIELGGTHVFVKTDPRLLSRVVAHLLDNALEAYSGTVEVALTADPHAVAVRITDRGPGLSTEILDRIGQPFFTTKANATGLGVAIAVRSLRALGGVLTIETSGHQLAFGPLSSDLAATAHTREGCRVTVSLPLTKTEQTRHDTV